MGWKIFAIIAKKLKIRIKIVDIDNAVQLINQLGNILNGF